MRISTTLTMEEKTRDLVGAEATACGMERSHFVEMVLLQHLSDDGRREQIDTLSRRLATVLIDRPATVAG